MSQTLLERGLKEKPVPVSTDALFIMDSDNGMDCATSNSRSIWNSNDIILGVCKLVL